VRGNVVRAIVVVDEALGRRQFPARHPRPVGQFNRVASGRQLVGGHKVRYGWEPATPFEKTRFDVDFQLTDRNGKTYGAGN